MKMSEIFNRMETAESWGIMRLISIINEMMRDFITVGDIKSLANLTLALETMVKWHKANGDRQLNELYTTLTHEVHYDIFMELNDVQTTRFLRIEKEMRG